MGVASGCGFKEIYRFPHTTYPYSSCICTFLQQHPYFFVHFLKCFSFLYIIIMMPLMQLYSALKTQGASKHKLLISVTMTVLDESHGLKWSHEPLIAMETHHFGSSC